MENEFNGHVDMYITRKRQTNNLLSWVASGLDMILSYDPLHIFSFTVGEDLMSQ